MMQATIPANEIVSVNPGVINAGGNPLAVNGVCLSTNLLLPVGDVEPFVTPLSVSEFFGPASAELAFAENYFLGYDNSTQKPGTLYFAPYNVNAREAFIQSGGFSGVPLSTLQALSGNLNIVVDGYARYGTNLNFSADSSFSIIATAIQTALNAPLTTSASSTASSIAGTTLTVGGTLTGTFLPGQTVTGSGVTAGSTILAQLTGSAGGAGTYQLSQSSTVSSESIAASPTTFATSTASSIAGTTLTVGGTLSGTFAPGQTILGAGVTASSIILSQLSGTTGGAGTYQLSQSSTVSSEAVTANATPVVVAWDAINSTFSITSDVSGAASTMAYATGTLATGLQFTSAAGAILSQGAAADTPASAMANVVANTQNWATFTTLLEPSLAHKLLYAIWSNEQNSRYLYVGWDTDVQATVANSTEPFGVLVDTAEYDGVMPLYNTSASAAFVMGAIASIDFGQTNGRITLAFKTQSGFIPTVTDAQIAANLLANGYSFYGAYATANEQFNFLYNGQVSGEWEWCDTFINQVFLNSQFQLALMNLLTQVTSIPYTPAGYSLIRAAMADPIAQALNFGSIRAGVILSALQAAEVNQEAGAQVSTIIQNQGYYLQILDPGSQVRGQRGTPIINFWYTDGGAVQKISLASIDIL